LSAISEISQLNTTSARQQNVVALDVSVNSVQQMYIRKGFQNLFKKKKGKKKKSQSSKSSLH